MLWRALVLVVLVVADLAMWAVALAGGLAENCYGDVSTLGCSSFAKNTAATLGIVGIIVIVAVVGVFADQRSRERARQDSNLRLLPPEGSALSTELRARDDEE